MNSIQDFIEKFKAQYIDGEQFEMKPDTSFRQIGSWDSLTGMAVLVMIHDEFGIDISVEKFRELITIEDVFNYLLDNDLSK